MVKLTGHFDRDASNRLCFEILDVDAVDHPNLVSQIVAHFELKSTSGLLVGPDQLMSAYSDGKCTVGLDWDNWSGFYVTAESPKAEPLVRAIGAFLSDR